MLILLDNLAEEWAQYYDTVALLLVCAICIPKRKSVVALVVLADFAIVYFCQNWLKTLELWGSLGLDYHYVLGIKDSLLALTLFLLAASPWLTIAYVLPALLCWSLWFSYSVVEYEIFKILYYSWSLPYALCMVLQIYGLTRGETDAGKRVRRKSLSFCWHRFFRPSYSFVYARITETHTNTQRIK